MSTSRVKAIGIDISHGQNVNWTQLKAAGYDFAIIKASHGYPGVTPNDIMIDNAYKEYFKENVLAAKEVGILVGAYHLVTATDLNTGENAGNYSVETQAKMFLDVVDYAGGFYNVKLPLCIDIEDEKYLTTEKDKTSSIVKAFALEISKRGYVPCLYFNRAFLYGAYGNDLSQFGIMPLWYARFSSDKTEEEVLQEVPNPMFWQIGARDVPEVTWSVTGSHNTDRDNCFIELYPSTGEGGAVYDLFQTVTNSYVYIDYCSKKLYAPTYYTYEYILSKIRSTPFPNRWYIIDNGNLVLVDRNMTPYDSLHIVRYVPRNGIDQS